MKHKQFGSIATTNRQTITVLRSARVESFYLPAPETEVISGVPWGRFDQFFTPAFWVSRVWIDGQQSALADYSIGRSLRDEVAACVLGGYGMPAEVGVAAFLKLRHEGLLNGCASVAEIERSLREPLQVHRRSVNYRYPHTKALFVEAAMRRLNTEQPPTNSSNELRNWLLTFKGVGPKTASWITRNVLGADDVAILDVHIVRAGRLMNLFSGQDSVEKDYFTMEKKLVDFANAVQMKLSRFDSLVWSYMKQLNEMAISALSGLEAEHQSA